MKYRSKYNEITLPLTAFTSLRVPLIFEDLLAPRSYFIVLSDRGTHLCHFYRLHRLVIRRRSRARRVNDPNFAKTSYRRTCAGPRLPAGSSLCSNTLFRQPLWIYERWRAIMFPIDVISPPEPFREAEIVSHDLSIIATILTADELFSIMLLDNDNLYIVSAIIVGVL